MKLKYLRFYDENYEIEKHKLPVFLQQGTICSRRKHYLEMPESLGVWTWALRHLARWWAVAYQDRNGEEFQR